MTSRTRIPTRENARFAHADSDPQRKERGSAASRDGQAPVSHDGAQSGGARAPKHVRTGAGGHPYNVEPPPAAYEGSLTTRTFDDSSRQGISSKSSKAEYAGQEKVVSARPDARAGLNHGNRRPSGHG
ncbi:MAG TPA: hypothetical protein VFB43_22525 [Terracidiphilus sp.]|nr:hypothetical protein [Terracidiphilus sp.]